MIAAKLDAFLDGRLGPDRSLSQRALRAAGIGQGRHLKNVLFEDGVSIDSGPTGPRDRVFVGAYSYVNAGGYLHGTVFIGRYCSIGRRVSVGAAAHAMTGLTTSPRLTGSASGPDVTDAYLARIGAPAPRPAGPTIIENDVWIGDGAILFPGIRIATGAVIGANAIVRRDVAPYAIVTGASSTPLRYRFGPDVRSDLLASRWWDLPHRTLGSLPTGNVIHLIAATRTLAADQNSGDRPTYALARWHRQTWPARMIRALRHRQ